MGFKKASVVLALLAIVLSGCQGNVTYTYLLEHPNFLQEENLRCSVTEMQTDEDDAYCKLVERATRFYGYVEYTTRQTRKIWPAHHGNRT